MNSPPLKDLIAQLTVARLLRACFWLWTTMGVVLLLLALVPIWKPLALLAPPGFDRDNGGRTALEGAALLVGAGVFWALPLLAGPIWALVVDLEAALEVGAVRIWPWASDLGRKAFALFRVLASVLGGMVLVGLAIALIIRMTQWTVRITQWWLSVF